MIVYKVVVIVLTNYYDFLTVEDAYLTVNCVFLNSAGVFLKDDMHLSNY